MSEEIDWTIGLNEECRTYTREEIMAVAKDPFEQWMVRIPLLSFDIRRSEDGKIEDGFFDRNVYYDSSPRKRVNDIADTLYTKQMNGFRLKYTIERTRELCYLRPLYPPVMNATEDVLEAYEHSKFSEKEKEIIIKFLCENKAEEHIDTIFEVDILKWTKDESSDRVTYFAGEQKRLMGRRSVKTLASYLRLFLPKEVKDHDLRELHSKVLAMHEKDDRYEVHLAFSESDIEEIYENTNFRSCMKRGEYIDSDLDTHPVVAYDSPDINVFGLFDKRRKHYIARTVANANTEEFGVIYPNDGTGTRGSASNRLKQWLQRAGYAGSARALNGCRIKIIQENGDYILPYVDGGSPRMVIQNEIAKILEWDENLQDHGFDSSKSFKIYAAQPTRGYVNGNDEAEMRD